MKLESKGVQAVLFDDVNLCLTHLEGAWPEHSITFSS